MNTIKIITITLFFIATISINADGQNNFPAPPCAPINAGIFTQSGQILKTPYYTTDMPLDVMISYIVIDSIRKGKTPDEIESYLSTLNYSNDTLRRLMKYLYTSVDFDPIRYERYMGASTLSPYITLSRITSDIATRMKTISPYPALDYTLLSSSYIAHVKVTNTFDKRKNFGNKTFWVMLREVTSDVKEIIKGKILPSCNTQTLSWNNDKPLTTNSCLQFNYGLQDLQIISLYGACDLIDTLPASSVNPSFKVEKNNEYIVFLRTNTICDDSLQSCIRLVIQGNANCLRDGGQTIRPLLALPIEN